MFHELVGQLGPQHFGSGGQAGTATRQITQAQQARDQRGWLAKMLKPNEGSEQMKQWTAQQAGLERKRVQIAQQRQGIEQDLVQASKQYQGVDEQYQNAQLYRDGVKGEQLVGRVSKHDLNDVLGRSRPRSGRGVSGAPKFGANRGHQRDNDPGLGL